MSNTQRIGIVILCAGLAAAVLIPPMLRAAGPTSGTRSLDAIKKDLTASDDELKAILPAPMMLGDADFRKQAGPKAIPVVKKMAGLFGELEKVDKADPDDVKEDHTNALRLMTYAAAFGDADALNMLDETGKSKSDPYALTAQSDALLARWIMNSTDADAQSKVLGQIAAVAKDNSHSREVASALNYMANIGGANNDLTKKAIEVIRANVMTDNVKDMLTQLDGQQAQLAMVGKPLDFEARTSMGSTFRLSSLKGKVVMLDFWATWCGPCIEELPNVKKAYMDYHDKGFDIVGLSCDDNDGVLNDFTKKEVMPWTQLREKSQSEADNWNPLAKKYGVLGIPTMFLVDKNGIVRYVDARDDLASKVAKLLAEEPKP